MAGTAIQSSCRWLRPFPLSPSEVGRPEHQSGSRDDRKRQRFPQRTLGQICSGGQNSGNGKLRGVLGRRRQLVGTERGGDRVERRYEQSHRREKGDADPKVPSQAGPVQHGDGISPLAAGGKAKRSCPRPWEGFRGSHNDRGETKANKVAPSCLRKVVSSLLPDTARYPRPALRQSTSAPGSRPVRRASGLHHVIGQRERAGLSTGPFLWKC